MANVVIYTKSTCPYCRKAKELLTSRQVKFHEIQIDHDLAKREEMIQRSQRQTVPQIFINDQHIGGFDDMATLDAAGKLDALLKN